MAVRRLQEGARLRLAVIMVCISGYTYRLDCVSASYVPHGVDHIPTRQLICACRLSLAGAAAVQAAALFEEARIVGGTVDRTIHCGQFVVRTAAAAEQCRVRCIHNRINLHCRQPVHHIHCVMSLGEHIHIPAMQRNLARQCARARECRKPRCRNHGGAAGAHSGKYDITPMQNATPTS